MDASQEIEESGLISKAAFEQLFLTHCQALCNVAYRLAGDRHLAEDIVQDFFYDFWKKHRDKQFEQSFLSYAQRAVRNRVIDYFRKKMNISTTQWDEDADVVEEADNVKNALENQETLYERLDRELAQLPENRRIIFLMSNKDGLKYKEIAEALNISINTVKTQIRLAYQQLRNNCLVILFILLIESLQFLHPFFSFHVFKL